MNASPRWVDGARSGSWATAAGPSWHTWAAAGWVPTMADEVEGIGWRRLAAAPPDPKGDASPGRRGWRSGPLAPLSAELMQRHDERRRVVRRLRRAGYPARREAVTEGRFTTGAVSGLKACDPWSLARDLDQCQAALGVALHENGASAAPFACNRRALCPVCAHRWGAQRAAAARAALAAPLAEGRGLALMTLTQRDRDGEPLQAAAGRLRAALRGLRKSREWRHVVEGALVGHEVTSRAAGRRWHPHAHVIVVVREGVNAEAARADLGRAWRRVSAAAAAAAGLDGYGWAPAAGGCRVAKTGRVRAWAGGWWRAMTDLEAVKQATKYATPIVEIDDPRALFEFCAYAAGRRWSEGLGSLRGYMAAALDDDSADEGATLDARADLGPRITQWGPGRAPALAAVAPQWGRHEAAEAVEQDGPALVAMRPTRAAAACAATLARLVALAVRCEGQGHELRLMVSAADLRALLGPGDRPTVARTSTKPPPGGWQVHGLPET